MKKIILSRRSFINRIAFSVLTVGLFGCTKTVTRYKPDGKPYTEDVEDPVATLAAFVLFLIIVGLIAENERRKEEGYSFNEQEDWQYFRNSKRNIFAASTVNKDNISISEEEQISVIDSDGRLIAVANGSSNVEHKDLGLIESLLTSARISNMQKTIAISLKQNRSNIFQIKNIKFIGKSSNNQHRTVEYCSNGKSYKVKVFPCLDNIVDIEIESTILFDQNVA